MEKFKLAIAIVSFAAVSLLLATQYRRRRKASSNPCYLHSDFKPQHAFKRVLADSSYSPFKHFNFKESKTGGVSSMTHPYEAEISNLLEKPPPDVCFCEGNVEMQLRDSYVWVETEAQLQELVDILSKESVFAVDTEQHSLRSFLGFTALIQISTQREDYLLDTIALHDVMGIIRPIFADPSICKVFHGADNDVLWLQRDFHVYVVNLFDTAKACEVLSKPQKSLAYLLETYCGVMANKTLQREDWRRRPLSEEMVQYARSDAHYLLHIANSLIAEIKLHENESSSNLNGGISLLAEVFRRSNMICLQLYMKDIENLPGESAASSIISRHLSPYDTKFQDTVRRLCTWRDLMARIHDENIKYVLPDQAIVTLAEYTPDDPVDVCSVVLETDENDVVLNSCITTPSAVVGSHMEDLCCLLQNHNASAEDIFQDILTKCLGRIGTCPLTVFNYALLTKCNVKRVNKFVHKQNGRKQSKRFSKRASRRDQFVQKFSCKSPVYHNCRIYANDGRLLCFCDRRKLEWYLRRDLAELIEENPPGIRLKFEPKGRPEDEDNDFYIQTKKNMCVGCGEQNHYLRYRVIPSCYRIHFPEHLKSHRSHDIVLLCVDCHEIAHAAAEKYKRRIAAELDIPLFIQKVVDSAQGEVTNGSSTSKADEEGVSPLQLRTAAMALLRHGTSMPSKRRDELIQTVMKYYGGRVITEEDLEKALLVGMSPHEKRRLEKKKGVFLKHSRPSGNPVKGSKDYKDPCITTAVVKYTSNSDEKVVSNTIEGESSNNQEDLGISMPADVNQTFLANGKFNGKVSIRDNNDIQSGIDEYSESQEASNLDRVDNNGIQMSSNEPAEFSYPTPEGTVSPKHNSKLSLLGHGPHGKQVVDHLLKVYGESGISVFCQQWRRVFVDAVHPRFLAPGWDVNHSGRREFGDFSVYNPSKLSFEATKS
ncbi:unnamed protein product [Rhodiola kirilowii]